VVISRICAEGEGIGVIDDDEIGGEGRGVKGGAEGLQTFEDVMKGDEIFSSGEVRQVGEWSGDAGGVWDRVEELGFGFALFELVMEEGDFSEELASGARESVGEEGGGEESEGEGFLSIDLANDFGGGDPKEGEERCGIVGADRPFGRSTGEEVLEEEWAGDAEPAGAEEWEKE
jgi:hypothetical protein